MTVLDFAIITSVTAANLFIGTSVLLKSPRSIVNQSFFVFVCGVSMWAIGLSLLYGTHDFLFDKLTLGGCLLFWFGMTLFARTFASDTPVSPRFFLIFVPLLAPALLLPFDLIIASIDVDAAGLIRPSLGPWFLAFGVCALAYTALTSWFLVRNLLRSSGKRRMQILYLVSGMLFFIASFVLFDIVLPYLGVYELNYLGPAASLVFILLTAYAIVRHQLMDIRFVIQRGLIYSILLGLIIALYITLIQLLSHVLGVDDELITFAAAIGTTVTGIFTAPHIEHWFRRITDRIFFKDTYSYADAMHTLSGVLYANVSFEDLVRESEHALAGILRASSARITLGASLSNTSEDAKAVQVPIRLDGDDIGCIHLGQKRSGDAYSPEDMQLLRTFAYQAATALSRAQLYQEAEQHAAELEHKVMERTRELSDAYARERQMLSDISHNLQTPLTVLQMKLDGLKRVLADDREVQSFEQSLSGFSAFIYDLLGLARLEAEASSSELAPLDLSDLLEEVTEEIGVIATDKGILAKNAIEAGIEIEGDIRRLREMLMNIASNALKHMRPDGTREVSFTLKSEQGYALLRIADTGSGIAVEDLPFVFDRFYRGKDMPSEIKGTGLGLAIAKRIVEQHGGSIRVTSENRNGTALEISLPLP